MIEINVDEAAKPLQELAEHSPNTPVAPAHGIAAIALSLAIKYHDITTVQDGEMYQQYKLEGKNMVPLHLDMVFETAVRMEKHLLGASARIAEIVVDALEVKLDEDEAKPESDEAESK